MDYCLQVRDHEMNRNTVLNGVREERFVTGFVIENQIDRIEHALFDYEKKKKEQYRRMNLQLTQIQNTLTKMKNKVAAFNCDQSQ